MDLLLIFLLLCMSAFFSGSESAMFSIRWWRINYLKHNAGSTGKVLADLMERPKGVLIAILLGNTLVNVAASSLTEHRLEALLPEQGLFIAIAAMTVILLVVGEITPKTLAIRDPEPFALFASRPIWLVMRLIFPVRIFLEKLSDAVTRRKDGNEVGRSRVDFLTLVDESRRGDIIDESEHSVLTRILQMDSVNIRDVMIPRTDIIAMPDTISFDEAVKSMLAHDFRRMPIYHESLDNIVGILYAKDLLGGWVNPVLQRQPKFMARPPFYVPGFVNLKQLSAELAQQKRHLAIVLDEYGGTAGLVTHDDILSTVFSPEKDRRVGANVLKSVDDGWDVEARITWDVLKELLQAKPASCEFRTLNGYLLDRFGKVPEPGEETTVELASAEGPSRWSITILSTEPIRIVSAAIRQVSNRKQSDD